MSIRTVLCRPPGEVPRPLMPAANLVLSESGPPIAIPTAEPPDPALTTVPRPVASYELRTVSPRSRLTVPVPRSGR